VVEYWSDGVIKDQIVCKMFKFDEIVKSIKTVMLNYLEVMKLNYKNMVHYFCKCIILTEK